MKNMSKNPTLIRYVQLLPVLLSFYTQSPYVTIHAFRTATINRLQSSNYDPTRLIQQQQQLLSTTCIVTNLRHGRIICSRRKSSPLYVEPVTAAMATATTAVTSSLAATLSSILSPIGSLLILAFIILVHESGHYIAAKQFNIKVEEFSIGFGPKLFSSRSIPGFQQDEFNVRAIPLGGYVRFPENYNTTLAREIQLYEVKQMEDFIRQRQPNLFEQILNALSLGIIEDQKWQQEKKRRILELTTSKMNEQIQTRNSIPFWKRFLSVPSSNDESKSQKSVQSIDLTTEIEYFTDPSLLQNKPWIQRAIVLSGGVLFNILLAFLLYFGQINLGSGLPVPIFDSGIVISSNPRPDAAANGLLQQGDIIVKVNGIDVMSSSSSSPQSKQTSISAISSQQAISDFIATIRSTKEGDTLALSVIRPTTPNQFTDAASTTVREVLIQPKRNGKNAPMTIGTLLAPNYKQTTVVKATNPIDAANLAIKYVTALTQETADGIFVLIRTLVLGLFGIGATANNGANAAVTSVAGQVSGPLGLLRTGSQVISTQDITTIVLFTSAISVNLAVINSLPFPALDGGQLVFVLSEAITGRKVNQQFQESLTTFAVLFLLLISLSTFVGDLNTVFGR